MSGENCYKDEFEKALLNVDRVMASSLFKKCYKQNKRFDLLENMVIQSLEKIGHNWEKGISSLAQVYMSGIICEELIEEYLPNEKRKKSNNPIIAIGVLEDHHALGKRIVHSVLKVSGYEVIDLGHGLTPEEIVNRAIDSNVEILLISTLMLESALEVKKVKEILSKRKKSIKIVVGGAPFRIDNELWKNVGADYFGSSASDITGIIERVVMS